MRLKMILALVVFVVIFGCQTNQPASPDQVVGNDSLYYSDQDKVDAYNKSKREEELRKKALREKREKQSDRTVNKNLEEKLTIDGWDSATNSIIDPINLWKNYQTRTYAGKVRHGETVVLIRRDGDGVLVETKSGLQGWVTYFFIKEYKDH